MFLEPFHKTTQCIKRLFSKSEPIRSRRNKLVRSLGSWHVGQHELSGKFLAGREEVVNLLRFPLHLPRNQLLANFPVAALRVWSEVFEGHDVSAVGGHGIDVTSDDFIKIFKLFCTNPQRLSE